MTKSTLAAVEALVGKRVLVVHRSGRTATPAHLGYLRGTLRRVADQPGYLEVAAAHRRSAYMAFALRAVLSVRHTDPHFLGIPVIRLA